MKEKWVQVPDFPRYEVSNLGRIRSWASSGHANDLWKPQPTILTAVRRNDGYREPSLRKKGRTYHFRLSRLILASFLGPCPEGFQAAHLNGNPEDNRLSNLAWVPPKINQKHRHAHGTAMIGEKAPWAKLSENEVREIVRSKGKIPPKELAKRFGVKVWTIYSIYEKKNWRSVPEVMAQ